MTIDEEYGEGDDWKKCEVCGKGVYMPKFVDEPLTEFITVT